MTGKNDGGNGDSLARVIWEQTRTQRLVHLYTGNGKGKTTAALGLALRALGRDRKVAVVQFLKRTRIKTGEVIFAEKVDCPLTIMQFGASRFASQEEQEDVERSGETVERGWQVASELVRKGEHDLIVLDEVTHVVNRGLVPLEALIALIREKAETVELVITGRDAPPELADVCDYVTEMKEIKHPCKIGIRAREGTEF